MRDLSTEILASRVNEDDFGFAFNDSDLSDRILLIKIMPDDSVGSDTNKYLKWFSWVNEAHSNDSESCAAVEVKTMHISSPILAAKSPFFYKLFKNGMKESQHRDVTLIVNASEEAALMELLYFIYHKTFTLRVTSVPELLDVLMAADKFEVISCMIYCIQLLVKLPLSLESALLYLELPSSVLVAEIVQPLIDAATQYLVENYRDFTESQEELMELSLSAVEVVLGSDGLQVNSEDDVFDFILKWARAHYANLEDRREILSKRLARFINFPCMSCLKLNDVVVCPDFRSEEALKLVFESLCPKLDIPYGQHMHALKDLISTKSSVSRRVYNYRLIKVVHLEFPKPRCVVYFDLKKEECANLFPSNSLSSQAILLGGRVFYLLAKCSEENHFGLFLQRSKDSEACTLDIEFAVMNVDEEFEIKVKVYRHECTTEILGEKNLLGISWTDFMSDYNDYFINGILHLRAELIIQSKA